MLRQGGARTPGQPPEIGYQAPSAIEEGSLSVRGTDLKDKIMVKLKPGPSIAVTKIMWGTLWRSSWCECSTADNNYCDHYRDWPLICSFFLFLWILLWTVASCLLKVQTWNFCLCMISMTWVTLISSLRELKPHPPAGWTCWLQLTANEKKVGSIDQ